jgi:hypothetical protein
MAYTIQIIPKPDYLHAIVTGENSRETVRLYLEELRRECATRGTARLLIDERLTGPRLEAWDVFQIAEENSKTYRGMLSAIAYVDVHMGKDLMAFAETTVLNRGVPIRVFSAVRDAEEWLSAGATSRSAAAPGGE